MGVFRLDPTNQHAVHPDDVLRVDRQLLNLGPVALYGSPERLQQNIEALQSYGYQCPMFDCTGWDSVEAMHQSFATELQFPGYYGRNLDALDDCLWGLEIPEVGGVALVFWRYDLFAKRFPEVAWQVLDIVAHQSWAALLYGRRLLGLVQSDDPNLRFQPVGAKPVAWNIWESLKIEEWANRINPSG